MPIKVIINGYQGKMGQVTVDTIASQPDLELVATTGRQDNLASAIQSTQADVVVDFTIPTAAFDNTKMIIANNARPVIGTSGLTINEIEELQTTCNKQSLGGIIAPNFSLGAVLMMKYAQDAAQYLPDVEIIEMHHPLKLDAPSGTARKTAEMIAAARGEHTAKNTSTDSARGDNYQGVNIHSVRLPGLFAHQMVMFGGQGETLTIRHDSTDRQSMMPGVFMACRKAMELNQLIYGLEKVL